MKFCYTHLGPSLLSAHSLHKYFIIQIYQILLKDTPDILNFMRLFCSCVMGCFLNQNSVHEKKKRKRNFILAGRFLLNIKTSCFENSSTVFFFPLVFPALNSTHWAN
mmetsp:Transcript_10494/g.12785  ORF Transcript_10494/g.12785 Transcript_10494/m.12785 type:complete len:107 (-) Transcript_10494:850-1170(-)